MMRKVNIEGIFVNVHALDGEMYNCKWALVFGYGTSFADCVPFVTKPTAKQIRGFKKEARVLRDYHIKNMDHDDVVISVLGMIQ